MDGLEVDTETRLKFEMFEVVMSLVDDKIISKQLGMVALQNEHIGYALKAKFDKEDMEQW